MKLGVLASFAFLYGLMATAAFAQNAAGQKGSAPTPEVFCTQPLANGVPSFRYPSRPVSISWHGREYPITGSVWVMGTTEQRTAVEKTLAAAWGPDGARPDLGFGITDARSVSGGVLVTTDAGEWGGAVWFVPANRRPVKIVSHNAVGMFDLGGKIVALTGLAHMIFDDGELFELDISGQTPTARSIAKLPGAPRAWTMAGADALLVATENEGMAFLQDGSIEKATVTRGCIDKW